jgi:hypothetical protein
MPKTNTEIRSRVGTSMMMRRRTYCCMAVLQIVAPAPLCLAEPSATMPVA